MINKIRLQHFRSYTDRTFALGEGVNIIAGPNASGKTNLLEAVLVAARGSSYKAKDAELVQFGSDWARLDAHVDDHIRTVKIRSGASAGKTFDLGGQVLTRLHPSRMLPAVLFEPNHLSLLSGSPDLRRTFLDDLIEQTEAGFGNLRRHYKRVLAQRNSLLKKNPPDILKQLFVWNVRLSELGGQIVKRRLALVERFNGQVPELYRHLAVRDNELELGYGSRFSSETYESQLLHKLEASAELDVLRGFTAYGPHRDDLLVTMDGHPLQDTASRGETRTLVLALKIVELQMVESAHEQRPILLLDDVFSELDSERRRALTEYARTYQTLITTTDADVVSKYFKSSNRIALGDQV
jgi:DNA replication and repair protein RecF